jgi:peptide/nickel transport system substrate-binding protein
MRRLAFFPFAILALIQFILGIALSPPSLAQEWELQVKPRGTLRVVDLFLPSPSVMLNYAESLVTVDKDNNWIPCLAEDWRWINDRTIDFKLRQGVIFQNGEKFNADSVRVSWEAYKAMETPRPHRWLCFPDDTKFEIIDEYTVRFVFPEPEGLAFVKFRWLFQFAPAFFVEHKFDEMNYGYLAEPGPWGTGPFEFAEGSLHYGKPSERIVLQANENYWDRRYPKVQKVIFDNTLIGNREEAMRLCMENEGAVDIVNRIRPLDTLKVAESPFAQVVKSREVALLLGWLNQRKRDSKWWDIRLRKAINYAVNREELWKYGAKGNAYNFGGFIQPGAFGHNPDLTLYTYDTTKAKHLLTEAGYPNGFEMNIITSEAWKLETQIISKMLERIGLKGSPQVFTRPEFMGKIYIPALKNPPEEQDWDLSILFIGDWYVHAGATVFSWYFTEKSELRWIEFDPVFEEMWEDMAKTVKTELQEEKVRQMVQYAYDRAHCLFIYSPILLYAANKEVQFVPQKCHVLLFKETSVTDNHWSLREENE